MINLIPIKEKKKIRAEYRFRLGVVVALASVSLFLISLVLLFPAYLLTLSKYQFASENLAKIEIEHGEVAQEEEIADQTSMVNKKINFFLQEGKESWMFSEVVIKIIEIKGPTIKIKNMSYESSLGKERFVISGRADDRDILASFVEKLKRDPSFTSVTIPISSYIKSTDIDFSIILEKSSLPLKK